VQVILPEGLVVRGLLAEHPLELFASGHISR
jgi:hypothetical protein